VTDSHKVSETVQSETAQSQTAQSQTAQSQTAQHLSIWPFIPQVDTRSAAETATVTRSYETRHDRPGRCLSRAFTVARRSSASTGSGVRPVRRVPATSLRI